MTIEEATEAVEEAKRKAHAAARRLLPGMSGQTSVIVNQARLAMVESLLVGLIARESQYPGTDELKMILEYRDYWEAIAEEIAR